MRSTSIKKKKRNLHSYAASVEFQQMRLEIIGAEFSMSCIFLCINCNTDFAYSGFIIHREGNALVILSWRVS